MKYYIIPQPKDVEFNNNKYFLPQDILYVTACQRIMEKLRTGINDFCKEVNNYCNIKIEGILKNFPLAGHINLIIDNMNFNGKDIESYELSIENNGIYIKSGAPQGLYYGLQTLTQIFKQVKEKTIFGIHIKDEPALKTRGILLDLRMQTFNLSYLLDFIRTLSSYKLNTLVIEYSDKFPYYGKYEAIRNVNCFSETDVETIVEYCHEHFIEIIPFVQSFGHMEYILRTDKYRYLRENENYDSQICPLHPDSLGVTRDLLQQICKFHKYSTHICIGGDEPFHLGECQRCAEYVEKYGKGGLYIYYVNELCKITNDMGLIVSICADKLLAYPSVIDLLKKDVVILDWDYWTYNDNPTKVMNWDTLKMVDSNDINGLSPDMKKFIINAAFDENNNIIPYTYTKYFIKKGFKVIGLCSTASVGPDCYWVPRYDVHVPNILFFCKYMKKYGGLGIINAAWEHFLFELAYYGFIYSAEQCWASDSNIIEFFNKKFANLFYGIDDTCVVEWQYKISQPFAIVEKKYPKIYKLQNYGRVPATVFELANNNMLAENIQGSLRVFRNNCESVKWNKYNLKQWELGAKIRMFWLNVTKHYAFAAEHPENENEIDKNLKYLDDELSLLKSDIAAILSSIMPIEVINAKLGSLFSLYEELKKDMEKKEFKHTGI